MNEQNLTPFGSDKMSTERHRELSARGGRARGAAIHRKMTMKEAAETFLSLQVRDESLKTMLRDSGVKNGDLNYRMAVAAELSLQAARGDTKAAKLLMDVLGNGQDPGQEVTILEDL